MDDTTNLMSPRPLGAGTHIGWFKIREVIGMGGLGITYRANDSKIDREVVIREYLPTAFAIRHVNYSVKPITGDHEQPYAQGLANFLTVAKTLEQFSHDNIVKVHNVIETNNTIYMVMECEYGVSLDSIIQQCGTFEQNHQAQIFFPIFKGLQKIHKLGFVHRSIKPSNIRIRENGSPVLLDFGSARQVSLRQPIESTALVNQDYMPLEQFSADYGKQGAWTDIYSLAAIMYQGVTGEKPDEALSRSDHLLRSQPDTVQELLAEAHPTYQQSFLSALHAGLTLQPQSRPQSLGRWQLLFRGDLEAYNRQLGGAASASMSDKSNTASPETNTPVRHEDTNPHHDTIKQSVDEPANVATNNMYDELDISLGPSATEDVDDEFLAAGVLATQPEKKNRGILSIVAGCAVVACMAVLMGVMYLKDNGTNLEPINNVAHSDSSEKVEQNTSKNSDDPSAVDLVADTKETTDTTDAATTDTSDDAPDTTDTTDATATDTSDDAPDTTDTTDTTDATVTDTSDDAPDTTDTTDATATDTSDDDAPDTTDTTDATATDTSDDAPDTTDTTDAAATDTSDDTPDTTDTSDAAATDTSDDTPDTTDTSDAAATDTSDEAPNTTDTTDAAATDTSDETPNTTDTTDAAATDAADDAPDTTNTTDAAASDTPSDSSETDLAANSSAPNGEQEKEVLAKLNDPAVAALTTVYFDKPVPNDTESAKPRTILEITDSVATFSPVEGMDDEFWKDKGCSDCHAWTRESLCTQGEFYNRSVDSKDAGSKDEDSKITRIQHPFGGYFKLALKNWAGNDCS